MTVTHSELVTQIRAYTEVDSSVLSDTIVNDFIEFAENRLFRDVDIDVFKSHQTANLTASNPFLSLPGGSAPTPDLAYNVELGITRLPTRLSSTNTTSWLGNNAPAALLYASLAEAFKFLKGPADMLQIYEQSYQRALQELVIEQQGRHRRDEYMQGALRTPLQSQNP